jgi:SnoaL-like domain
MTTRAIAERLASLCGAGEYVGAIRALYASEVKQSENRGPFVSGRDTVAEACRAWVESRVVHGTTILGTHVGADSFVLEMTHDVTPHETKVRHQWSEAGVYRVANGKIAEVVFYYRPPAI